MLKRLGRAAKEARLVAGLTQLDIATAAGVSHGAISRFEGGKAWPKIGADRLVGVYEGECRLQQDELWERAIRPTRRP